MIMYRKEAEIKIELTLTWEEYKEIKKEATAVKKSLENTQCTKPEDKSIYKNIYNLINQIENI